MKRVFNFNPGPATLPLEALKKAQAEFLDYKNTGMSVLEISHRSQEVGDMLEETKSDLRELWSIPDNYKILFLQGGASSQFFMVPMNLAGDNVVDYVITGTWSEKALKEAKILDKKVNVVYSSKATNYDRVPKPSELKFSKDAAYIHITTNNTIFGTQWHYLPETNGVPLVMDMSSDILSYPIDFKNVGLIYAGAQKNLGPAGVTIVIIREDLLERVPMNLPSMLKYTTHVEKNSLYNTGPIFAIYMVGLVLKWLKNIGGVSKIKEINEKKAKLIYDVIDTFNGFYRGHSQKESRSLMNITFTLPSKELEEKFVKEAAEIGLVGLKGHRSVGGMRASIYNAMSLEGCQKLAEFMHDFAERNK